MARAALRDCRRDGKQTRRNVASSQRTPFKPRAADSFEMQIVSRSVLRRSVADIHERSRKRAPALCVHDRSSGKSTTTDLATSVRQRLLRQYARGSRPWIRGSCGHMSGTSCHACQGCEPAGTGTAEHRWDHSRRFEARSVSFARADCAAPTRPCSLARAPLCTPAPNSLIMYSTKMPLS